MLSKQTKSFYIELWENKQNTVRNATQHKQTPQFFKWDLKFRPRAQPLGLTEFLFEHSSDFYYCSITQERVLESALIPFILLGVSEYNDQMALQGNFLEYSQCITTDNMYAANTTTRIGYADFLTHTARKA